MVRRLLSLLAALALLAAACGGSEIDEDVGATPDQQSAAVADQESAAVDNAEAEPDREPGGAIDAAGCLVHEEIEYCHEVFTPAGVDGTAPLVIDLHGFTATAQRQRAGSGFEQLASDEGFTVVWPQGHASSWNGGERCCGVAAGEDLDDVGYIRALVDEVAATHPVDRSRIYATGLSNGCAMAQRLAADASDLVAAVGCMALYLLDEPDPGYEPVPVMEIHGTNDLVVPYDGAITGFGAAENIAAWAERNGCTGDPVVEDGPDITTARHEGCDGADVVLVTVTEGGHALYRGMETEVDTSRLAWEFMSRFRRGS